jgi:hypothetical protein
MQENKQKKIWFRKKRYGWGWTPASWEGWLILFVYVFLLVWSFRSIDAVQHSGSDTLINFVPRFIIFSLILIFICYKKGDKPKWTWGEK